ncbi:MAG: sigma-70 family RNA polymerase sigma factor [Propionibacteriaceae bacterium]|jgi:RNA polymerase sigma factor (sigma-70 family)
MSDDPFVAHRSLLFTVAYELLGSATDAEDAVQETWLRWDGIGADGQAEVADSRAYLVKIVTRQTLNRLRTLARRKEESVGEWLPEPLLTTPAVADDVELAESVSIAMLTVLETLTPTERAVFVLREVLALPFDEIAAATGKLAAAVRQVAHRARSRVAARPPRMEVDRAEQRRVRSRNNARAGSRRTHPCHLRGSAAHRRSAGWHAPHPRPLASRTPWRSLRHGSSSLPPASPGL